MSDKLKPCPFCGGEAKNTFINWKPAIQCKICKANVYREYLEQVEGVEVLLWNTRKPIDRIVEKLEQQAEQYRRRGFETEQKGFSKEADKYYGKQCSYLHAIEIVKAGGIDG